MSKLESIIGKTIMKAEYSCGGGLMIITFSDGSKFIVSDGSVYDDGFITEYEGTIK